MGVRNLPLILQLDVAGNPQKWISYQDSCSHYTKGNVAWSMGSMDFDIYGGTCAATGKRTIVTINTIIAIKGIMSPKAMVHYDRVPISNRTLFARDCYTCGYCGNKYTNSHLTRDHIHPTSKGGENKWTNIITACENCNKIKGNKMLNELDMQLLYVPYVPNRAEWLILKNRKVLTDQMEFLLRRVPDMSRLHAIN